MSRKNKIDPAEKVKIIERVLADFIVFCNRQFGVYSCGDSYGPFVPARVRRSLHSDSEFCIVSDGVISGSIPAERALEIAAPESDFCSGCRCSDRRSA